MTPLFRRPVLSDASGLYKMIEQHAAFERSTAPLTVLDLERMLQAIPPTIHFLVALLRNEVVAYAAVTFDWSTWRARRYAHLDCLFVNPAQRGTGIGKQLLAEVKTIALAEGADRLEWQTPSWNVDAQRFYLSEGAACQDKLRFSLDLLYISS